MREMMARRNRLIHHQGIPDGDYNILTGHRGKVRLKTDTKYVYDSLKSAEQIRRKVENFIWKKYINPKLLEQMSSEDCLDEISSNAIETN